MQVSIRTKGCELSEENRKLVIDRTERLGKFLDGLDRAEVAFVSETNPSIAEKQLCEATLFGHGHVIRAKAASTEAIAAFDKVYERLEHRLEKLKGKLVMRTHPHHRTSKAIDADALLDGGTPQITKSKSFKIGPMTADEAAFQMEMLGHSFYFFRNLDTGEPAVVYMRRDGTAGLIDTAAAE